jgi:hypothetical protein
MGISNYLPDVLYPKTYGLLKFTLHPLFDVCKQEHFRDCAPRAKPRLRMAQIWPKNLRDSVESQLVQRLRLTVSQSPQAEPTICPA